MNDLATILASIQDLSAGEVAVVAQAVAARLAAIIIAPQPSTGPDRLMDVREAAKRLGISTITLYRHADDYPFTRRIGPKNGGLRFSERGIQDWLAHQGK